MPKVSEEHRSRMRARILGATLAVVRRKGMAATTMGDIIAESGLSAGAIYGYFPSKDALIASFVAEMINSRFDHIGEMQRRTPIPHPLDAIAELVAGVDEAHDGVVVQVWGLAPVDPALAAMTREWVAGFTSRMQGYTAAWLRENGVGDEVADARAASITPALIGLSQGYFVRGALAGAEDLGRYREALHALAGWIAPPGADTP